MPTSEQIEAAAKALFAIDIAGVLFEWGENDALTDDFRTQARAALEAVEALEEVEWGVEYEVSSTESVYTAAHSEKQARKWVAQSPTDTGLRKRRPASPWIEIEKEAGNA